MMTLEMFREHVLKGKSVEELCDLIEDFKIEQAFLKVKIEEKNIGDFTLPPQDMVAKINKYRLYIRDTYIKIKSIGGEIKRSDEEEFAIQFHENISNIHRIDYQIGGYFEGNEEYYLAFDDSSTTNDGMDRETFLKEFSELHIGEWRESYADSDYGEQVMDGTSWSLNIHFYGDIKPAEFSGINAFPYNFGMLDQIIKKASID